MNKIEVLQKINAAKRAHVSWVMKADALIQGIPLEKEQVPINGTECMFGQWYYGEGQGLLALEAFKTIEQPHYQLHHCYAKIFKLLFEGDDHTFLSKLFGKNKHHETAKIEQAKLIFQELKKHSEEVVRLLDNLTSQIESVSDKKPYIKIAS